MDLLATKLVHENATAVLRTNGHAAVPLALTVAAIFEKPYFHKVIHSSSLDSIVKIVICSPPGKVANIQLGTTAISALREGRGGSVLG